MKSFNYLVTNIFFNKYSNDVKKFNETVFHHINQIKTLEDFDKTKKEAANLESEMQTLDYLAKVLRESVKSGNK
jgi:hypothetical protein